MVETISLTFTCYLEKLSPAHKKSQPLLSKRLKLFQFQIISVQRHWLVMVITCPRSWCCLKCWCWQISASEIKFSALHLQCRWCQITLSHTRMLESRSIIGLDTEYGQILSLVPQIYSHWLTQSTPSLVFCQRRNDFVDRIFSWIFLNTLTLFLPEIANLLFILAKLKDYAWTPLRQKPT